MMDDGLAMGVPITRTVLAEQIAQHILQLIQTGVLKPDQQLPPERELALKLGVSRPSLREALRALSLLGVLVKRQGDGVFVSTLSSEALLAPLHFFVSLEPHHLDSLFEARMIVESGITRIAAERISADVLEQLRTCTEHGGKNIDNPAAFLEADMRFHHLIVESTKNPFLERVSQSLGILGKASRELTVQLPGVRQQSHADHEDVFDALMKHDPDQASRAMHRHLENVWRAYQQHAHTESNHQ